MVTLPVGSTRATAEQAGQAGHAGPATPDRRRWLAAAVMLTATFMDLLDATIVNVAIPSIRADLDAGYAATQWITAGYALSFALLLITGGRLGDIIGRKRTFQFGVAGFTAASLLCGLAPGPTVLVVARTLQGVAAALMVPQVMAIIHATFPARERPKAFAIFGAITGLAAVIGPIAGGLLIGASPFGLGWRTIFLINVPVGVMSLIAGRHVIGESRSTQRLRLDLAGVALSALGLMLLLYPLVKGHELGWPMWTYASMAAGVAVLAGLARQQRNTERAGGCPLIVASLFGSRGFTIGLGVQLGFYCVVGLFFLSWNIYLQAGLGFTALRGGLTTVAFAAGAFLSSALAVTVLFRAYGRLVLTVGVLVEILGICLLAWTVHSAGTEIGSRHVVAPLVLMGIGFGLVAAPLPVVVLQDAPTQAAGSAAGLSNTVTQLGVAVGVALVSVAFLVPLGDRFAPDDFVHAVTVSLVAMTGILTVVAALTFHLPKHARSA
jgi:EmrB/QacA subfamily drug resistance transporter